jgi:threonine/homoserine/homoserine lactone efflux protein
MGPHTTGRHTTGENPAPVGGSVANIAAVRSVWEFFALAVVLTLTPGPATAMIVRVAARDGRRAALSATLGNGAGVLSWGLLSAVGVSSLIVASQVAYDVLRIAGACVLITIGVRSLVHRRTEADPTGTGVTARRAGWQSGLLSGLSNPKLAVFFIALFPQFLVPGAPVLPYAMAMAATVVALDVLWFSTLAFAVDRARTWIRPTVQSILERCTGAVLVGLGIRLATESR